jgi:methionine synthase II (cobalamin-independent)
VFATLLGGLPRPLDADGEPILDDDAAVLAAIEAQAAAGLEPLTDGRLRSAGPFGAISGLDGVRIGPRGPRLTGRPTWRAPLTVPGWRWASERAGRLVKQALPGPYTLARRLAPGDADAAGLAFAAALRAEIQALADAGCALIEIEERDADRIGPDPVERARFREAHLAMIDGLDGVHLSLAIVGGNADTAGIETILAAPYQSLAVDLIDGPDNWRLVTATPGDRGIVCGVLSVHDPSDDGPELRVWAAAYATASGSRGRDRVGLATSGGYEGLPWAVAVRKMRALGRAAEIAGLPADAAAAELDPRAVDIRTAALGHRARRPRPRGPRVP